MTRRFRLPPLNARQTRVRWPFLTALLLLLAIAGISRQTLAQEHASDWAAPVNLSLSGAASSPTIVAVPDGTLRVFWWDPYDGLMVAEGTIPSALAPDAAPSESGGKGWSEPESAPIMLVETIVRGGQEQQISRPIEFRPRIVGDADGWAHAFWLGDPDEETDERPLMYSRLAPGRTFWSPPLVLNQAASNFDMTTDASGTLHLVYVRPVQTQELPVGLYYRRSRDSGVTWSVPAMVQQSRYYRMLPADDASLRLTADGPDSVYATWNDPRQEQVLLAQSADGGKTWQEPRPYSASDGVPLHTQVIAVPGRPVQLLWESAGEEEGTMLASTTENALTLARWAGGHLSETRHLVLGFEDPELGAPLRLRDLQLALASPPSGQEETGQTLAAVGIDQNNDVWISGIQVEALEYFWNMAPDYSASQTPGEDQVQAKPVLSANLSRGGAASNPAIVTGPGDTLRAFWWDQYDGLMVADGTLSASALLSGTEEVLIPRVFWSEPRPVPLSVQTVPRILADTSGRVHAFWLQEVERGAQDTVKMVGQPLMHSYFTADGVDWSSPTTLAEAAVGFDVATDASGALHLAYVDTPRTPSAPATVYYRQAGQDGASWSAPVAVYESRYLRSLSPETAHLSLATDDAGGVWVTWDDPHLDRSLLAHSSDGGVTWGPSTPVGDPGGASQRGRVIAVPGSETILLWETGSATGTCSLYQAPANAVLAGGENRGQRVLEGLAGCPENERFLSLGEGQVLMVVGSGGDVLTLVVWDGERWSEPTRWSFDFEEPEMGVRVFLRELQMALAGLFAGSPGGAADKALVAIGTDGAGDIWATSSHVGNLEVLFAPPPPWSSPIALSEGEPFPGLPAVATDEMGRTHVLWTEASERGEPGTGFLYARWDGSADTDPDGEQWTRPVPVLQSSEGGAEEPAMIAAGDRLHTVWSGGQNGEILYSNSFARDAYAAAGWSKPVPLPAPASIGSWPDITADADGTLHVVYAVPVNEERGIYYTRSLDGGTTWSPALRVFDAVAAEWVMVDYPRLTEDGQGGLHVVWVRFALPGSDRPKGIHYSRSNDGGETWSKPETVAEGAHAWPQVAASGGGQLHILWNEVTGQQPWWHSWSADGGLVWTRSERVPVSGDLSAPTSLLADGKGTLYLVGVGHEDNGRQSLLFSTWDGQRWAASEASSLDMDSLEPGAAATLATDLQRVDVIFRGEARAEEGMGWAQLWHTGRQISAVDVQPVLTETASSAATPSQTALPTLDSPQTSVTAPNPTQMPPTTSVPAATSSSTPSFDATRPDTTGSSGSISAALLVSGGLAALIVAGALAWWFLWRERRR